MDSGWDYNIEVSTRAGVRLIKQYKLVIETQTESIRVPFRGNCLRSKQESKGNHF